MSRNMKSESPTTATRQNTIRDIHGDSLLDNVPEKREIVNGQFVLSPVGRVRIPPEKEVHAVSAVTVFVPVFDFWREWKLSF